MPANSQQQIHSRNKQISAADSPDQISTDTKQGPKATLLLGQILQVCVTAAGVVEVAWILHWYVHP
jgi:hypothetical protein